MGKFAYSFVKLYKNPVSRWCTVGAMFRYVGMFACDYHLPMYFIHSFPKYQTVFALLYSFIIVTCGFSSPIIVGFLCDKFGPGKPMFKSWVCIIGNLVAMPMFLISVLSGKFWLSMVMITGNFLCA